MALFKIKKGLAAALPTTYTEGFCYFTTDDGKFYIDTNNTAAGRVCLNAAHADTADTATNLAAAPTVAWASGTTDGPKLTVTAGGKTSSLVAIPVASSSASGVVTTGT